MMYIQEQISKDSMTLDDQYLLLICFYHTHHLDLGFRSKIVTLIYPLPSTIEVTMDSTTGSRVAVLQAGALNDKQRSTLQNMVSLNE